MRFRFIAAEKAESHHEHRLHLCCIAGVRLAFICSVASFPSPSGREDVLCVVVGLVLFLPRAPYLLEVCWVTPSTQLCERPAWSCHPNYGTVS
jgi:hypothetical protein